MRSAGNLWLAGTRMSSSYTGCPPCSDTSLRDEFGSDTIAARGWAFGLASSDDRSYGVGIYGVEPDFERKVSNIPGLIEQGRFFENNDAMEIVIGTMLARNLRVGVGDELTLLGSGLDGLEHQLRVVAAQRLDDVLAGGHAAELVVELASVTGNRRQLRRDGDDVHRLGP